MIRLGTLAGYSFEGPRLLGGWSPPSGPAVYAIVYKAAPNDKPNKYSVIYIDHAEDLQQAGLPFKHPQAPCWIKTAQSKWNLYICTFEVYAYGGHHRETICRELIADYEPRCNQQKYDRAWKDEWIGEYKADTTGPLAPRGPDESPR